MIFHRKALTACLLTCIMLLQLALPTAAATDGFEAATGHVSIAPAKQLSILYPAKDIQTTAAGFQITGASDPGRPLTMNGEVIDSRGSGGTFAIYVALDGGVNSFVFRQGDASASITITKDDTSGIGNIDTAGSSLFSSASISEQGGHTTIILTQSSPVALWGYLVEYRDGQAITVNTARRSQAAAASP